VNELRMKRVESVIREQISSLIMNGEIKDPRVNSLLSITSVKVSNDLSSAKLYVSGLEGDAKLKKSVDALNHAAGFIQNRIGKQLTMRLTPRLHFFSDTSIREGYMLNRKIENLLHENTDKEDS